MLTLTDVASEIVEQMHGRHMRADQLGPIAQLIATELRAAGYDLRREPSLEEVKRILVSVCRSAREQSARGRSAGRRPAGERATSVNRLERLFVGSIWDEWA